MNNKKLKSVIAGILTAVIVATSVPTTVFAKERKTVTSNASQEQQQTALAINYFVVQPNTQNNMGGYILVANAAGQGTVEYRFYEVINNKKVYIPDITKYQQQIEQYKTIVENYKKILTTKINTSITYIKNIIAKYESMITAYTNKINALIANINKYMDQFEKYKATIDIAMKKLNGYIATVNKYLEVINNYLHPTKTQKAAYAKVQSTSANLTQFKYGEYSQTPYVLWKPVKKGNHVLGVEVKDSTGKTVNKTLTYTVPAATTK